MKTPIVTTLLSASALLWASCDVRQPPLACPVQRLTWATRMVLKEGQTVSGPCANKKGERMGIQKYNDPTTDKSSLVIKPETLAKYDAVDPDSPSFSLGDFAAQPDADALCGATGLSVAEKHVPATAAAPADDIRYAWKSARVTSSADAPGSQFAGELLYTAGGCTAEYEVWGVWPSIGCKNADGAADDSLCGSSANLNPDFALMCDPTQLRCVPAKRPPSLR
jgi:hypothetical protein